MRYVEARIEQETRDEAYRIYVTKSLQLAPQNKYINVTYGDLLNKNKEKVDDRSGEEIIIDVMEKAGLSFEV